TKTKEIKEEFEQLGQLKISDDLNRLSGINNDFFTYEIEVPRPTPYDEQQTSNPTHNDIREYEWKISYEECKKIYAKAIIFIKKRRVRLIDVTMEQWLDLKYENHETMNKDFNKGIKRQRETYTREVDMEYNPSNLVFAEWLASKFYNHLEMDWYTMNTLWVYWMRGDDEVVLSNKEASDCKDENNDDEHEIAEIFRIETNLFDYETPTKTYEKYENELDLELGKPWSKKGVPYEICDHICESFCFKNRKTKWPIDNSNKDGLRNGGELLECCWKINDHECPPFANWRDHIRGPYANYYSNVQDEVEQENNERCELINDRELPICKIRRFEMIK
ncbi:hypothetical protein Tco_1452930, partial [Tanacetum coccineum]